MNQTIVSLKGVVKSFSSADGAPRVVLDNVDFTLREREIVALLGQSGSGKSTLLRIMAGLVMADGGDVLYRGQPLYGPARGISMVFQSFALFPWLTVQQNVEIGLEARGVPAAEREKRAEKVIDMIGLSGFEGALPRELSGGMRQRVGIARALVVDPDVLLMDEAFSALDVLTGERLRDDILELWEEEQISTKAILVVSHNIQEAIMMADRVLIFASDPGRVRYEMRVDLPRPRDADSPEVRMLVDEIYAVMTAGRVRTGKTVEPLRLDERLPEADIGLMEGLLERLMDDPFLGHADLPQLGEETELTDEELLPAAEALACWNLCYSRAAIWPSPIWASSMWPPNTMSARPCLPSNCSSACRWRPTSSTACCKIPRASSRKSISWPCCATAWTRKRPNACSMWPSSGDAMARSTATTTTPA